MPFRISHLILICLALSLAAACRAPSPPVLARERAAVSSAEMGVWLLGGLPDPDRPILRLSADGIQQEAAPRIALALDGQSLEQIASAPDENGGTFCRTAYRLDPESRPFFRITTGISKGRLTAWLELMSTLEVELEAPGVQFKGLLGPGDRLQILGDAAWPIDRAEPTLWSIADEADGELLGPLIAQLRLWQAKPGGPLPGVFGMLSDKFSGRVFWDHDLWIFPALSLLDPESARAIVDYRLRTLSEARKTAGVGVRIPWEANQAGQDMAQGEAEQSLGAGAAAAWMLNRAAQLGLAEPAASQEAQEGIAEFFVAASEPGPQGRSIRKVRSIDEYVIVDNDLFLQAGVDLLWQRLGIPHRARLPRSSEGELLNYEPDTERPMQQAAGMLAAWPLQHPVAEPQGEKLVQRWLPRVIKSGPRMSVSVAATILARAGRPEEARELWVNEINGNTQGFFREKPLNPEAPFITGVAGLVNTVLYGFIGLDIGRNEPSRAAWKKRLKSGAWIWANPQVPESWGQIVLGPVYLDGEPFRFAASTGALSVAPFSPLPAPAR